MDVLTCAFFETCACMFFQKLCQICQIFHIHKHMKRIVNHEIYGPVIFDTATQSFEHIDYADFKFIDGERYFENVISFEHSSSRMAIVPLVCVGVKAIKKRTIANFLDWNNRVLNFFNVEMIEEKWTKNSIEGAIVNKCYLAVLQRNELAINDYLLIKLQSIYEIKKL